ncbi:hypothetical protein H4582DRAFT_1267083 [Lactarius indigo]|nr:hypothetical protein H4582DRAFT_1267083 [Lactarius indigo]
MTSTCSGLLSATGTFRQRSPHRHPYTAWVPFSLFFFFYLLELEAHHVDSLAFVTLFRVDNRLFLTPDQILDHHLRSHSVQRLISDFRLLWSRLTSAMCLLVSLNHRLRRKARHQSIVPCLKWVSSFPKSPTVSTVPLTVSKSSFASPSCGLVS